MAARRSTDTPPRKKMSEVELCAAFIAWTQANSDWVAYSETGGFDMLLVASDGRSSASKPNFPAPPNWSIRRCPKTAFRALPVPISAASCCRSARAEIPGAAAVAGPAGLLRLAARRRVSRRVIDRSNGLVALGSGAADRAATFLARRRRGAAVADPADEIQNCRPKLIALIEVRGYVVSQDFRDLGIDSRRWTNPKNGLLQFDSQGRYQRGEKLIFDKQHPRVFAEIVAASKRSASLASLPTRSHGNRDTSMPSDVRRVNRDCHTITNH